MLVEATVTINASRAAIWAAITDIEKKGKQNRRVRMSLAD